MAPVAFNSVLIIAGISVLVPVILGLLPWLPVPGAVLQVIFGIVVGPSVLGWARIDAPVQVLSTLGLGMLLFLAGLEIDVERLRTPLSRLAGLAFGLSVALALLVGFLFFLAEQGLPGQARRDRVRVPRPDLLHQHGGGLPVEGPAGPPGGPRGGPAVPGRLAGRAGSASIAVPACGGPPPRGGRRAAAGNHADVRHRGGRSRAGNREAHAGHGRCSRRRRPAVRGPVSRECGSAARPAEAPLRAPRYAGTCSAGPLAWAVGALATPGPPGGTIDRSAREAGAEGTGVGRSPRQPGRPRGLGLAHVVSYVVSCD
jgi:hypothetical protein